MKAILRAHVERVEPGKIYYETLGEQNALAFDFAMLAAQAWAESRAVRQGEGAGARGTSTTAPPRSASGRSCRPFSYQR